MLAKTTAKKKSRYDIISVTNEKEGDLCGTKNRKNSFTKISEVAEVLGVRYNTVWRLIQNGTIPGVKVGKTWYVPASFFDDLQKQAKKEVV